jgi:hypothetical protein
MDAPVAGEALAFEGWRFDPRAGGLLRHGASGVWVPVSVGARARDVVVFSAPQLSLIELRELAAMLDDDARRYRCWW